MLNVIHYFIKVDPFNPWKMGILFHATYLLRRRLYKSISRFSDKIQWTVLDFGCGNKPYAPLFKNAITYIGVDYESTGHNHSNESIDVYYDGKTIPFPNAHFDSLVCTEVFEHVFNPDALLLEIHRVLKPWAYGIVTTPFFFEEHEKPYDFARYTSFWLKHLLERNGFEVVDSVKTSNYVETIAQLWNTYIEKVLSRPWKFWTIIRTILWGSSTSMWLILGKLLPDNRDAYLNNVFLIKKTKPC